MIGLNERVILKSFPYSFVNNYITVMRNEILIAGISGSLRPKPYNTMVEIVNRK